MQRDAQGAEAGQPEVLVLEKGPGWVLFAPDQPGPWPDDLPLGLSQVLERWLAAKPELPNVKVTTKGGETLIITGLVAGQVLPLRITRVHSTSTTATNLCALW